MALSLEFRLRWQPSAGARHFMSWYQDLGSQIEQQKQDQERADRVRLHKAGVLQSKSGLLFDQLKKGSHTGVIALGTKFREFSNVEFTEQNIWSFVVRNPTYPAIAVEVQGLGDAIRIIRRTLRDANSSVKEQQEQIDLSVDDGDNVVMTYQGNKVENTDAALRIILDPVFRQ